MTDLPIVYVKPCWGVFREGDRRTLVAYPSRDDAIRYALAGVDVNVVVLDDEGKVTERLTKWTHP